MTNHGEDNPLLTEQIAYYRAIAPEYGLESIPGADEEALLGRVQDALHAEPTAHALELACGPGVWTPHLLEHADAVTAVDASPEMLALAAKRVQGRRDVRFVQADIFDWQPPRRFDLVFFGFWLSHVPDTRFEEFWSLVGRCLEPSGRVLFIDDAYRAADELIEGEESSTIRRRISDGTEFRIVKVAHRPQVLQRRLGELGWQIAVEAMGGPFYIGQGYRTVASEST